MEAAIRYLLKRHRERDKSDEAVSMVEREEKQLKTLREKVKKIKRWLDHNDDKPGKGGKPKKSNITDNESAKMKSSHGVIQGYDGVATVDAKHQVVVHAEVFGGAQEHDLSVPMIEGARETFQGIDSDRDIFEDTKLTADAGFHTEANMKRLFEEGIDGYVADTLFRRRDPRFLPKRTAIKNGIVRNGARRGGKTVRSYLPTTIFITIPSGNFVSVLRARSSIVTGATWSSTAIKP